jgi:hypothetical protein
MSSLALSTAVRPTRLSGTAPPPSATPGCDVCPHAVTQHDAIGLRFCRATRDSALDRGCVCGPA